MRGHNENDMQTVAPRCQLKIPRALQNTEIFVFPVGDRGGKSTALFHIIIIYRITQLRKNVTRLKCTVAGLTIADDVFD